MDNEKKEEFVETTENNEKKENEQKEEQTINESKEKEQVVEDEKKEEPKTEPQINNRSSNDLRPRKWLLVILVVITIAIVGVLVYKTVLGISSALSNSNGSWGVFNLFKGNDTFEENAEDIINETQKEVTNQREKIAKDSFNYKFEQNIGTNYSTVVGWLLDDVILNNKKNKDYLITVVFKYKSTTNPEEIKNFKKQFISNHQYEVSIDYDDEGYVNKITIEE